MLTGVEIDRLLDLKIDKVYTGYFNPTQRSRIINNTLIRVIEDRYANLSTQKNIDEIGNIVKTEEPFNTFANQLPIRPFFIVSVSATSPTVFRIILDRQMSTDANDTEIEISGCSGSGAITNLNGVQSTYSIVNSTTIDVTVSSTVLATYNPYSGVLFSKKNNKFGSVSETIASDYYHLLSIRCDSQESVNTSCSAVKNGSPCVITLTSNNIRTGEKLYISPLDEYLYAKKINAQKVALYEDENLTTPYTSVSLTVNDFDGIYRVLSKYATPYVSDRKISVFGVPSSYNPKYEVSQYSIKLYPSNLVIGRVYMDYISLPVEIDLTNQYIDYSIYYNPNFLNHLVDETAKMIAQIVSNPEQYKFMVQEITDNP